MIEFRDTAPDVDVQPAEYIRLLGFPRGWVLADRSKELADWARDWYARHGHPWVYVRQAASLQTDGRVILIEDVAFSSRRLQRTLPIAGAHAAVLVAASAGPEIDREAQKRWREEKPDEYFFLETYGSAVVEHLITTIGSRLCAWAEGEGCAVLPHDSPGYPDWVIEEQPKLLDLIQRASREALPLDVLDSGMLRPKKSQLAVFGLTRHTERVRRLTDLNPCETCSFGPCQYRRAPYRRAAAYTVSLKALKRWSQERLTIAAQPDGTVEAVFRYEGTTCTNMGRPLEFLYHVTLGPREEGFPILRQACRPAPGDEGHKAMCRYIREGEPLIASIADERPLGGQPLDEVVRWTRASSPSGCYCEPESRQHKWGLVLETIHYALSREPDRARTPVVRQGVPTARFLRGGVEKEAL